MAERNFVFRRFRAAVDDPLTSEHRAVEKWVEDALASLDSHHWYQDVDLKSLEGGRELLDSKPEQARRIVMAAVAQARYWNDETRRVQGQAATDLERMNAHMLPGWSEVWGRYRQTVAVVAALMRRALPFESSDLIAILSWCKGQAPLSAYTTPVGVVTRAVERYAKRHRLDPELREALQEFAAALRGSPDKEVSRLGTLVEQLLAEDTPQATFVASDAEAALVEIRPLQRGPAGHPAMLNALKSHFRLQDVDAPQPAIEQVGADLFPLRADSPLRKEHALLTDLFDEVVGGPSYHSPQIEKTGTGRLIIASDSKARGFVVLALAERAVASLFRSADLENQRGWQSQYAAWGALHPVLALGFDFDRAGLFDFFLFLSVRLTSHQAQEYWGLLDELLDQIEEEASSASLTDGERYVLHLVRVSRVSGPPMGAPHRAVVRLTRMIGDGATFYLVPGEAWTDALNVEMGRLSLSRREHWIAWLRHLLTATGARPSEKWLKKAAKLVDAIGAEDVATALLRWLPLVTEGRTVRRVGSYISDTRSAGDVMDDENATCLRGMLWLCPSLPQMDELWRVVTQVALSAYKKTPGIGPRAVKVGNAAVYALSQSKSLLALGQLALLKVRVKFGTAQKEIEKAFHTAAEALGLPRDQVEEMGVPSYGLEEVGMRRETFGNGDFSVTLRVEGNNVTLNWARSDGKPQKSVPARIKSEHKEELKELQDTVKDIGAMLPAQAERIDSMFLLQKSWPLPTWRERYLDHPLIGTVARRLLWMGAGIPILFVDNEFRSVDGKRVVLQDYATIELWHPIGRPLEEILAWRQFVEEHRITQPFKQTHREVYLLTDAEVQTRTYSNRFAAHIIRQHQFNALCAARGWKNRLRLMVDDTVPPATRDLPQFGLRAEFWVEPIGENYGVDTSDSGAYLRLSTDQVRFYRSGAAENSAHVGGGGYTSRAVGPGDSGINEPIPLDSVPPLVFSEIMRDVDLFVGVASVGNDPNWADGGPEGRYQTYWQSYAFGELGATAQTRKAVLERIIPRLKIAGRCSFSERFLVVRGDVRTYKIHLGSGNILMSPNDQYLCVVPKQVAASAHQSGIFLPFEGDSTLSIILSKAFLLADDTQIADRTIVRQIGMHES